MASCMDFVVDMKYTGGTLLVPIFFFFMYNTFFNVPSKATTHADFCFAILVGQALPVAPSNGLPRMLIYGYLLGNPIHLDYI